MENEGDFEWRDGLLLSDSIINPNSFLPEIDQDYGLIRRKSQTVLFTTSLFNQGKFLIEKKIPLKEQDIVNFFRKESRTNILEDLLSDIRKQSKRRKL